MPSVGTPTSKRAGSTCGAPWGVHRLGPAGQDDRLGVPGCDLGRSRGVRHDLGVDPRLADAAGDQLGVLGAEVDHYDQVVVKLAHGRSSDGLGSVESKADRNPDAGHARPARFSTRNIPVITEVKDLPSRPWLGANGRPDWVATDWTSTKRRMPSWP